MNLIKSETYSPDNLIAGCAPDMVTYPIVVASGQGELPRGQLMGKLTAGGEYVKCLSTNGDGSQAGKVILSEDIDATDASVSTIGYIEGEFNENAVIFAAPDTADTHREALKDRSIILRGSVEVA